MTDQLRLPHLDPRYVAGCALVQRLGTLGEISAMLANRAEVQEINRLTERWIAEQQRKEAA